MDYYSRLARRLTHWLLDGGGALAIATAAVYVALAPAHIVDGDNAEYATLGAVGGVAHPSGYPLYILYLRATSWLPGSTPAHTAAIATALLGAAAVWMVYAAARAWGAGRFGAHVAAAIVAVAPAMMRMATQAEVFALNNLVVATVVWLAAPQGQVTGARRVIALAAVAGLGLSNHMTCTSVAPLGIAGVVIGLREVAGGGRARLRVAAIGAGAFVLGLAPYLYLAVAADAPASWGHIDGPSALVRHVLRMPYGGPFAFASATGHLHPVANLAALGATLARSWLWLPLAGGVVVLIARVARGPHRAMWGCVALALVLAGPALVARFDLDPGAPLARYVVTRFHLVTVILFAIPVAMAFDRIARRVETHRRAALIAAAAGVVVLAAGTAVALPGLRRAHSPALERALTTMLETAPAHAIVIARGDHLAGGGAYLELARGLRPDVTLIAPGLCGMGWYRARVARALATPTVPSGDDRALVDLAIATGRPVLIERTLADMLGLTTVPLGFLRRVVPAGTAPPALDAVLADNRAWFERLDLDYPAPRTDDDWPAVIHAEYFETWAQLTVMLRAAGRSAEAAVAQARARELAPREVDP